MKLRMAALLLLVFASATAYPSPRSDDKRLEQLDKERQKLKKEADPIDRTKIHIRISEILLSLIGDAVKGGDFEALNQNLTQYCDAIHAAHETMINSGKSAHDKPKGFKDLELALRRQSRQLNDLGGALAFDEREPLEKAKRVADDIRDQLMKALFIEEKNAQATRS